MSGEMEQPEQEACSEALIVLSENCTSADKDLAAATSRRWTQFVTPNLRADIETIKKVGDPIDVERLLIWRNLKEIGQNIFLEEVKHLDRSSEPFPQQLAQAFALLGQASSHLSCEFDPNKATIGSGAVFGPREEWVLRWLLKKMNLGSGKHSEPLRPALQAEAWLLLRVLIARLPIALCARLLHEFRFSTILSDTLNELRLRNPKEIWLMDENSSLCEDSSSSSRNNRDSRKRKRDQADLESDTSESSGSESELDTLRSSPRTLPITGSSVFQPFLAICGTLEQVKFKLEHATSPSQRFAAEYMKLALKCDLEKAVRILETSLSLMAFQMRPTDGLDRKASFRHSFTNLLRPFILIWDIRDVSPDVTELTQTQLFCDKCLVPALEILSLNRINNIGLEMGMIEQLIATHCIVPAHGAYVRAFNQNSTTSEALTDSYEYLLRPLSESQRRVKYRRTVEDADHIGPFHCISIFFEIALKYLDVLMIRSRTGVKWMQEFFSYLLSCASFDLLGTSSEISMQSVETVMELLQLALEHDIGLERSLLESIIARILCTSQSRAYEFWIIVSCCSKIEADIFVLDRHSTTPSPTISALVACLGNTQSSSEYSNSLSLFVLPFLHANVQARNLQSFLRFREESLAECLKAEAPATNSDREMGYAQKFWRDARLCSEVSSVVQRSMTPQQISSMIVDQIAMLRPSGAEGWNAAACEAAATTFRDLLNGVEAEEHSVATMRMVRTLHDLHCNVIIQNVSQCISNKIFWQNESILCEKWSYTYSALVTHDLKNKILATAAKTVSKVLLSKNVPGEEIYQESFCAFYFILQALGKLSLVEDVKSSLMHIFGELTSLIDGNHEKLNKLSRAWEMSQDSITGHRRLISACATLLIEQPFGLDHLDASHRKPFLQHVHAHAFYKWCKEIDFNDNATWGMNPPDGDSYTWLSLWKLLCSSTVNHSALIKQDVKGILMSALEELCSEPNENAQDIPDRRLSFATFGLLQQRFEDWSRQERTNLANRTLLLACKKRHTDGWLRNSILLVLQRLLTEPSEDMDIIQHPSTHLGSLGRLYDRDMHSEVIRNASVIKHITAKVICHRISESRKNGLVLRVPRIIAEMQSIKRGEICSASWTWMTTFLQKFGEEYPDPLDDMRDACTTFLSTMAETLCNISVSQASSDRHLIPILNGFIVMKSFLYLARQQILDCTTHLMKATNPQAGLNYNSISDELDSDVALDIFNKSQRLSCMLNIDNHQSVLQIMQRAATINHYSNIQAASDLLTDVQNHVKALNAGDQAQFIRRFTVKDELSESELHLLHKVVKLNFPDSSEPPWNDQTIQLAVVLRELVHRLLLVLESSKSEGQVREASAVLDSLLRKQSWAVSQSNVDSILASITIVAPATGLHREHQHAPGLFAWLCVLTASLLAVHRIKISGRHHLLLEALQALLAGFFTPYGHVKTLPMTQANKVRGLDEQNQAAIRVEHAVSFARILTTICDPSPSSVKRSTHRLQHVLNDETKKARIIAGQYLQYLLMEFCHLHLHGKLDPEVRSALNPGIYAIFDAMTQDVLTTVNAALDAPARSLFQMLYEDYKKFGKEKA